MNKSMFGALVLSAMVSGTRARAEAARAEVEPHLQFSAISGKIEVETPNRWESVSGQLLPSIRSGSVVRVREGAAAFRSDMRVTVRAGKGDAFQFTAISSETGRNISQRFAAVETEPDALVVSVGEEKFQIRSKGGALVLTPTAPGEVTVKAERGPIMISAGGSAEDGGIRKTERLLRVGEAVIVPVSKETAFEAPEMGLTGISITRKSGTTFTAEGASRESNEDTASAVESRRGLAAWPEASRTVAVAMIEKYGPPSASDEDRLTWDSNGAWKRTNVYRAPSGRADVLEQTVRYAVPAEKREAVAKIDVELSVSPIDEELSATSESEATNFLAVNLADEVVRGLKTPEEAREFYLKTVKLTAAGKSSPYTQGLLFKP